MKIVLLFLAAASFAFAGTNPAPEIDANMAGSALALISGGLLVLRSRRNK
jgi:hypothetical protein